MTFIFALKGHFSFLSLQKAARDRSPVWMRGGGGGTRTNSSGTHPFPYYKGTHSNHICNSTNLDGFTPSPSSLWALSVIAARQSFLGIKLENAVTAQLLEINEWMKKQAAAQPGSSNLIVSKAICISVALKHISHKHIYRLYAHANKHINKRDRWERGGREGRKSEIILSSSRKVAYFPYTRNICRN